MKQLGIYLAIWEDEILQRQIVPRQIVLLYFQYEDKFSLQLFCPWGKLYYTQLCNLRLVNASEDLL